MAINEAIATINTEIGDMTIYYHGPGEPMTVEAGTVVDEFDYSPRDRDDAIDTIHHLYSSWDWCLTWVED